MEEHKLNENIFNDSEINYKDGLNQDDFVKIIK